MRASVDEAACTGCGLCADVCPDVFFLDGDVARAKMSEVPEDLEDCAEDAADGCPTEAILIDW
ncbi:MAG: ferredoxin [Candidatus Eisenbacteria bacterium]